MSERALIQIWPLMKNAQRRFENNIKMELASHYSSSQEHALHDEGTADRRNAAIL